VLTIRALHGHSGLTLIGHRARRELAAIFAVPGGTVLELPVSCSVAMPWLVAGVGTAMVAGR
jgi:hypothetical protein